MKISKIYSNYKNILNQEVEINGWIRTIRSSKKFGFIEINDGSFFKNIQVVFEDNLENFNEISKFTISSSIKVGGILIESPGNKQNFELKAEKIELLGEADLDYPLQKKRHTFEYLRTIAHLRPRANSFSAAFRVRSTTSKAIHDFFYNRGFVYVHTPIITGSDCEGAGEMLFLFQERLTMQNFR